MFLGALGTIGNVLGAVSGTSKSKGGLLGTGIGATKKKRRRKAKLTRGDILELTEIKNVLGKTAAGNALQFYLGRR